MACSKGNDSATIGALHNAAIRRLDRPPRVFLLGTPTGVTARML
jgi:hypothetical protein